MYIRDAKEWTLCNADFLVSQRELDDYDILPDATERNIFVHATRNACVNVCRLNISARRKDKFVQDHTYTASTERSSDNAIQRDASRSTASTSLAVADDLPEISVARTINQIQLPFTSTADTSSGFRLSRTQSASAENGAAPSSTGHSYGYTVVESGGNVRQGDSYRYEVQVRNGVPATQAGAGCIVSAGAGGALVGLAMVHGNSMTPEVPVIHNAAGALELGVLEAGDSALMHDPPYGSSTECSAISSEVVDLDEVFENDEVDHFDDDEVTIMDMGTEDGDYDERTLASSASERAATGDTATISPASDDGVDTRSVASGNTEYTLHSTNYTPNSNIVPQYQGTPTKVFQVMSLDGIPQRKLLVGALDTGADVCIIRESSARPLAVNRRSFRQDICTVDGRHLPTIGQVRLRLKTVNTRLQFAVDAYVVRDEHLHTSEMVVSCKVIMRHHLLCDSMCYWKTTRILLWLLRELQTAIRMWYAGSIRFVRKTSRTTPCISRTFRESWHL